MRFQILSVCTAVALVACLGSSPVLGQPLVTGELTAYYDFDEIVEEVTRDVGGSDVTGRGFLDESGNNFHGFINEGDSADLDPGTLTLETTNTMRGAGAASFNQSSDNLDLPVFVDLLGEDISLNHSDQLPTDAFTIAAWVNVNQTGGDQSIFQTRSSGGGFNHLQLQGNGKFRFRLRGFANSDNIVGAQKYLDGSEDNVDASYPFNEWVHYAGTYDMASDHWALYANGTEIGSGQANGCEFPGECNAELGDWIGQVEFGDFFSAGIGAVMDSGGRRLDGLVDEWYVFHRALDSDEICVLAFCDGGDTADFDKDGDVDGDDFLVWQSNFGTMEGATANTGDTDMDGDVDGDDFLAWQSQFGNGVEGGGSSAIPEPTSLLAIALMGLALVARRRR